MLFVLIATDSERISKGFNMDEKKFDNLEFERLCDLDGVHAFMKFDNGRGVSVIRHAGSYGNKNGEGLYELMMTDAEGHVTGVPAGWLDESAVSDAMVAVQRLSKSPVFKSIRA